MKMIWIEEQRSSQYHRRDSQVPLGITFTIPAAWKEGARVFKLTRSPEYPCRCDGWKFFWGRERQVVENPAGHPSMHGASSFTWSPHLREIWYKMAPSVFEPDGFNNVGVDRLMPGGDYDVQCTMYIAAARFLFLDWFQLKNAITESALKEFGKH